MESKSPWKLTPVAAPSAAPVRKKKAVHKDLWEEKRKAELSAMSEDELFDAVLDEEEEQLLFDDKVEYQKVQGEDSEVEENTFSAPASMKLVEDLGIDPDSYNNGLIEDVKQKDGTFILARTTYGDVKKAILTSGGMITHVARRLNLSTRLVKRVFEKYKSLGQMFEEYREAMLDEVEMLLINKIRSGEKGDTLAMIFYLKCVGKERGYIDRAIDNKAKKAPVRLKIVGAESYAGKRERLSKKDASERTLQ